MRPSTPIKDEHDVGGCGEGKEGVLRTGLRSDADGNSTWGPTSRPVPQWTRPGATPVETLGRRGHHH